MRFFTKRKKNSLLFSLFSGNFEARQWRSILMTPIGLSQQIHWIFTAMGLRWKGAAWYNSIRTNENQWQVGCRCEKRGNV
jgi:hypothetical protein